jgi:hypothetical protein
MSGTEYATERSRLLDNEDGLSDRSRGQEGDRDSNDEQDADDVPLAKEASTRELLAVLSATWVGVFFAALGIESRG